MIFVASSRVHAFIVTVRVFPALSSWSAACIAITLLASVWSSTQLIAGVVGGVMVTLLVVAWMLAHDTEEPLKQFFNYVALHNIHFSTFSRGTLNLRDVVYYLGVIVVFLEASARSLEAWRWRE